MRPPSSHRDRWAQLRFLIVGRLFAEPPEPGDLFNRLLELANKTWRHPVTGQEIRFGVSTLERWYYRARKAHDPVGLLKNRPSSHYGTFPSLGLEIREQLCAQYLGGRLERFQQMVILEEGHGVLDFWAWDKERNADRFSGVSL